MKVGDSGPPPREIIEQGYDHRDVSSRHLMMFAAALTTLLVATVWALALIEPLLQRKDANRTPPALPAEPRLQANPTLDYREFRKSEDEILTGYHWIDRERGIVSIPIEEAKRQVLEQGFLVREEIQ